MQAQINPSLQALLQTAQMVTPEQGPTVAKQVAQAAMQKMQASAPPGIASLLPGVQQQAAQSAQAAQPATQGDVNQLRQMLAQAAPPQMNAGVGGLGKDVQMAEGGVVGYAGPDGSDVELDVSGRIKKALRDWYERTERDYMERAGATPEMIAQKLGREAPVAAPVVERPRGQENYEPAPQLIVGNAPPVAPEAQRLMDRQRPPVSRQPAPQAERKQPVANTGIAAAMLPDTRESTAVNPSEAALMHAQMQGQLKDLREALSRKPAESEAEKAYRAAAMAEYQRGLGGIEAARQRMAESQKKQKEMDFINYLSGMGGAGSLVEGARRSGQALSQTQQQREASRLAYEDKLEDRRNIVENLKLATLRQDAESARAWANELRKNEAEIAKLSIDLNKDRAAQLATAEREREKTEATARENALNRAKDFEIERIRRATADRPGEAERIEAEFRRLKATNPAEAEAYLQRIERIKGITQRANAADERSRIARQKLMESNPLYKLAKIQESQEKDPAKRAEAQRKVQEIERRAGIFDENDSSAATKIPSGVTVTKVGP